MANTKMKRDVDEKYAKDPGVIISNKHGLTRDYDKYLKGKEKAIAQSPKIHKLQTVRCPDLPGNAFIVIEKKGNADKRRIEYMKNFPDFNKAI